MRATSTPPPPTSTARYVFTGTPAAPLVPGNATVVGSAPGYGADVQTKSLTSGTTNVQDLQLPPTVLTGVVTDQATGLPLPGATVVVTDSAGHVYTTTADINGRYVFTGTPAAPLVSGNATVAGSAPGYGSDVQTKSLVGGTTNVQDLQLPPTVLTGVVTDQATGLPLPGATVVVTDSAGHVYTATADINGRYVFTGTPAAPLDPGNATVAGSAPGYGADVQTKSLVAGTTNIQDLQLPPTVLTGVVTDQATGLPLPGATVVVTDSAGHVYTTTADINGRYVFTGTPAAPLDPGNATVVGSAPGYGADVQTKSLTSGTTNIQDLQLPPTVLTGVVTDQATGLPLPGATVVVTDSAGHVYTTTADINGRYVFTGTPAAPLVSGNATVAGSAPGYGADVQTKSLASGTTNVQDLQLPPTVLTGVVTDQATGLPLPGATVVVTDSAGHVYTTTADINGRYVFTGTPAAPLVAGTPRSPAAPPATAATSRPRA